jgi:hypothetical protein
MGEERNVYKILMGKLEGKRPLGSPRRRWENGIRADFREMDWGECRVDVVGSGLGNGDTLLGMRCKPADSGTTDLVDFLTS